MDAAAEGLKDKVVEVARTVDQLKVQGHFKSSINDAIETLKELLAEKKVPKDAITEAKGLVFLCTRKVGLGVSTNDGWGIVIAKLPSGSWSGPVPLIANGIGVGVTVGYTQMQTMVSLATDDDLKAFRRGEAPGKFGVDWGLQVGPVNIGSGTDTYTKQKNEETGIHTRVFSISKGLMLDVGLDGTGAEVDLLDMKICYGDNITARDVLGGKVPQPLEARELYELLGGVASSAK